MINVEGALCAQTDPDLFFPDMETTKSDKARQICVRCPIMRDCLIESLGIPREHDWGIWGGSTLAQRRRINRGIATVNQIILETQREFGE